MTTRPSALVVAAHPGPSAVVGLVALGLAVASGLSPGRTALVVAAVVAGQLSIGWANDWLDGIRGVDAERVDKPVATGAVTPAALRRAALIAAGLCVVLSLLLGPVPAAVHLVAVAGGWAYDAGLKATAASWVPYAVSFGLLPSVVTAAGAGSPLAPVWAMAVGACFGIGVHVANVLPDLDVDARAGVRGMPQRLGAGRSVVAIVVLLGAGTVGAVLGPGLPAGGRLAVVAGLAVAATAALVVVAVAGARRRADVAYGAAMACGLVVVGLLVARGDALV